MASGSRARVAAAARGLLCQPTGPYLGSRPPVGGWAGTYLEERGWLRPGVSNVQRAAAVDALSAALTFPLTCAHAWARLFPLANARITKLCIVGARAEASLPVVFWGELGVLTQSGLELQLVGPAAKARPQEHEAGPHRVSTVLPVAPMCYHQTPVGRALLRAAREGEGLTDLPGLPDAYVLFNPGLGEPGWEKAWRPTVDALKASNKPLLLTALSRADADRDAAFWAATGSTTSRLEYEPNPWSSLVPGADDPTSLSNSMLCVVAKPSL